MRLATSIGLATAMLLMGTAAVIAAAPGTPDAQLKPEERWVRIWGAAMMAPEEFDYYPGLGRSFHNVTLRQIVVVNLGGKTLRVQISNQYGSRALRIGAARVARVDPASRTVASPDAPPRTIASSDRELLFHGERSVVLPAGSVMFSDAFQLDVAAGTSLAISLYLPDSTANSTSTVHEEGWRLGYVSTAGDHCAAADFPVGAELQSMYYIAGVDVVSTGNAATVVALGDSITDGTGATPHAGRTWPDNLSKRLSAASPGRFAVINMGIGGNRLIHAETGPSALARVDRDVFAIPGVRYLLILEGINDIAGWPEHPEQDVSAGDVIGALTQLADRAHLRGLRVMGATMTPTLGCPDCGGEKGEEIRQAVNTWIRSGAPYDAIVDFDLVVSDPAEPRRLKAEFDCGDHLHLSDAGYRAVAAAIDLSFFR